MIPERIQKRLLLLLWAETLIVCSLFWFEVLPTGFIPTTPQAQYLVDLLCFALTFGGGYATLRFMALQPWRVAIMEVIIMTDVIGYFGCPADQTPMYCLLSALALSIFCWNARSKKPQETEASDSQTV